MVGEREIGDEYDFKFSIGTWGRMGFDEDFYS